MKSPPLSVSSALLSGRLSVSSADLRLDTVLKCGQSFRWTKVGDRWLGAAADSAFILQQDGEGISYASLSGDVDAKAALEDYFQLNVDLKPLYASWSKADPVFDAVAASFPGVRILRQDPVENVFSFICSSNNNIQRISSMVENLCSRYGPEICTLDVDGTVRAVHAFPSAERLAADGVEAELRQLGFGYRAAYIAKAARQIVEKGGKEYLVGLRKMDYTEARKELLELNGVGPKVADCVLLMSLDQPSAIPVDTHMFQIARDKYLPQLRGVKSVTDKVYAQIGDCFRGLYGPYAGWAHSVLFSSDLKHLKPSADSDKGQETKSESPKKRKKAAVKCESSKVRKSCKN